MESLQKRSFIGKIEHQRLKLWIQYQNTLTITEKEVLACALYYDVTKKNSSAYVKKIVYIQADFQISRGQRRKCSNHFLTAYSSLQLTLY